MSIEKLIAKHSNSSNSFEPFIKSIVFCNYKNIKHLEELTFDFPITLLIGKNGTNKSSALHALYGCPDGKSTGEYWFSTHIDPIDTKNNRPAFFYRFMDSNSKVIVEVIKTIIVKDTPKKKYSLNSKLINQKLQKKKHDPDYWEPSRPILKYGMKKVPIILDKINIPAGRSKTRWNAIKKRVTYLDFRSEISAFDKAFYKDRLEISRPDHRKKLRNQSKQLKNAIEKNLASHIRYRNERINRNYSFTTEEIGIVNEILGSSYIEIQYIEHDFYLSKSYSIYLKKGSIGNYSEAFAGSGETSVVRMIYALERTNQNSLVLLDEPETSLHIDAQYKLCDYIVKITLLKNLQVVISTHSPYFAKNLPDNAIKIFTPDLDPEGRISIINNAPASEGSFHLGYRRPSSDKLNIIVEDRLAKAIVDYACNKHLPESTRDLFTISHFVGGSNELIKKSTYDYTNKSTKTIYLFDGDIKPASEILYAQEIPVSKDGKLESMISNWLGMNVKIPQDSNSSGSQFSNLRKYIDFIKDRFYYLPFNTPELFLVKNIDELNKRIYSNSNKKCIEEYAKEQLEDSGDVKSIDIFSVQRLLLNKIPDDHHTYIEIAEILRKITVKFKDS